MVSFVPISAKRTRKVSTLSQEIIRDNLIRLPVKSLIRFSSVSKAWFNLFRTSKFLSDHLPRHTQKNPHLIVERFYWGHKNSGLDLFLLETQMKRLQEIHIPYVTDSDMGFKIVGSCNGLICACHYSLDPAAILFIWNPATRQIRRILEQPHALLPHKVSPKCLSGFCYNASDDDYEVVRVHSFDDRDSVGWGLSLNGIHAIRVPKYSLRSGSWEEVECNSNFVTVNGAVFWTENCVAVKGTMFWVAMEVNEWSTLELIFSFEAEKKVPRKIRVPNSGNHSPEVYKKLAVYKGSVAMLICSEAETMEHYLNLWVLDDKCNGEKIWVKAQTIGLFLRLERPVSRWKNEVLMASRNVIHSVGGIKALFPAGEVGAGYSYNVFNYAESLVPIYGGNGNKMDEEDELYKSKGDSLHDLLLSKLGIEE